MPSQLYKNDAIYFMCARDFLWAGENYKMGDTFDQDLAPGRLDMLIRNRWLVAVVDNHEDLPRHWRHHVWEREIVSKKLGLLNNPKVKTLTGDNLYNKPEQGLGEAASAPLAKAQVADSDKMWAAEDENIRQERVLEDANEETPEYDPEEDQSEPEALVEPAEGNEPEEDDRAITEEDLYDPSEHTVPEVNEYLADADEEERQRVLDAERQGKNRKMIVGD